MNIKRELCLTVIIADKWNFYENSFLDVCQVIRRADDAKEDLFLHIAAQFSSDFLQLLKADSADIVRKNHYRL